MYYFVPAWYHEQNIWGDTTKAWYDQTHHMEFDDIVSFAKMFHLSQEEARLLVIKYSPNLRRRLSRLGLLHIPYNSVFDYLQGIERNFNKPFDYYELDWPSGTEFLFTPFLIIARCDGEMIAYIEMAEDGNVQWIDYIKNGQMNRRLAIDDRGFVSSLTVFDEYQEWLYCDYYNEKGEVRFRENNLPSNQTVELSEELTIIFGNKIMPSMTDFVSKSLQYIMNDKIQDLKGVIIGSHFRHNRLLADLSLAAPLVFTFFENRNKNMELNLKEISKAKFLVADTRKMELKLRQECQKLGLGEAYIQRLIPFDTRLRLGRSQSVRELKICVHISEVNQDITKIRMETLLDQMAENPLIELDLISFQDFSESLLREKFDDLIKEKYSPELFYQIEEQIIGDNQIDHEEVITLPRIRYHHIQSELDLINVLDEARLVIDFQEEPDLFLQIAAISAGIPQINQSENNYVKHLENGWILSEDSDLSKALHFYFDGLSNWNNALVSTVTEMNRYTSGVLVSVWQELLKG